MFYSLGCANFIYFTARRDLVWSPHDIFTSVSPCGCQSPLQARTASPHSLLLSPCVQGDVQQCPAFMGSTPPQLLRMPLCFSPQPLGLVGCPKTSTTCSHDLWHWVGMREPQGSAVSKNCSKSPEHLLSLLVFRVRIYILAIFFLDR